MSEVERARIFERDANLFDFFQDQVGRANDEAGRPVSQEGTWYLSNLLVEQANTGRRPPEEQAQTLVELRLQAAQADRVQALRIWRALGDKAMLLSGYFHRSLAHRRLSRSYAMEMGSSAYQVVAGLLGAGSKAPVLGEGGRDLGDIYQELAARFQDCAEVLAEVGEAVREGVEGPARDQDLLATYEAWLATGNPRLAARLVRLGLLPARSG